MSQEMLFTKKTEIITPEIVKNDLIFQLSPKLSQKVLQKRKEDNESIVPLHPFIESTTSCDRLSINAPNKEGENHKNEEEKMFWKESPKTIKEFLQQAKITLSSMSSTPLGSPSKLERKSALDLDPPIIIPPSPLSSSSSSSFSLSFKNRMAQSPKLSIHSDVTSIETYTVDGKDNIKDNRNSKEDKTEDEKPWYMLSLSEIQNGKYERILSKSKPPTIKEIRQRCFDLMDEYYQIDEEIINKRRNIEKYRNKLKVMVKLGNRLEEELRGFQQCKSLYQTISVKQNIKQQHRNTIERSMHRRLKKYYDNLEHQQNMVKELEKEREKDQQKDSIVDVIVNVSNDRIDETMEDFTNHTDDVPTEEIDIKDITMDDS